MTKLAYERPVMRAEAFATNAYCNSCASSVSWTGCLVATVKNFWGGIVAKGWFSSNPNPMINQNTGRQQYYYKECEDHEGHQVDEHTYYLEWSENRNSFYMYRENSKSGYYDQLDGTMTDSGADSLQVRGALDGWQYSMATGWWYSDDRIGEATYDVDGGLVLTVSG